MKGQGMKVFFVILFSISSVLLFRPVFISSQVLYYLYYAFFIIAGLFTVTKIHQFEKESFSAPLFILISAILISAFSATLFWSQGFIWSFMALPLYLSYILYFLLLGWKLNPASLEKAIITLGIIYIIIYTITFFAYPTPVFGNIEGVSTDRGFQRVMLEGRGFLFLFSFYALGRFYTRKEPLWLIIFLITVISVIMLLTRTLIAGALVLWTLFILRKSQYINKILAMIFIAGFVYLFSQMSFSKLLLRETVSQTENLNDYIRVRAATFYLNQFSPNIYTKIFGNGEPYKETGYAEYMNYIEKGLGLYTSDIGYIGLYTKFGLLSIIAYMLLIIRTFRIKVPDEYLYCKYFLYFVFIISIIIDAPFSASFIAPIVIALYLLSANDLSRQQVQVIVDHQKA